MIRSAAPADAPSIVAIEQACFGAEALSLAVVEDDIAAAHRETRVFQPDDEPVGYLSLSMAGDVADLERVAVVPHARQRGIATTLVEDAARLAFSAGATQMMLEVEDENAAARSVYEATGFVEVSTRSNYPRRGVTSLVMQRTLR